MKKGNPLKCRERKVMSNQKSKFIWKNTKYKPLQLLDDEKEKIKMLTK